MSPKGGSGGRGGGGGGGSASCENCTRPLRLTGYNWKFPTSTAYFVIDVLVALTLLVCIILQTRFKWRSNNHTRDKRTNRYFYATTCLLFSYILYITDLALNEESYTTIYLYYLIYIFASLLWRIADVLILLIIYRTIAQSTLTRNLAQRLTIPHRSLVGIIAFTSFVTFAFGTTQTAMVISGQGSSHVVYSGNLYSSVVYHALYFVAAVLAFMESFLVVRREKSKLNLITSSLTTPALLIRSTFLLISVSLTLYQVTWFSTRSRGIPTRILRELTWACGFISDIATAVVYLGVVLVGFLKFRRGGEGYVAGRNGSEQIGFVNGGGEKERRSGWKRLVAWRK